MIITQRLYLLEGQVMSGNVRGGTWTYQETHGGLVSITQSIQGLKMKRGIKAGIYEQDGIKETHF